MSQRDTSAVSPISAPPMYSTTETTRYQQMGASARRSVSNPSTLNSKQSGPSPVEAPFIKSTWGIGWQTPTLMLISYLLAVVLAISHLVFVQYINGKDADGSGEVIPQSYVSTISNVLSNVFGYALKACLSLAFVQYLWHLLRVNNMKVSTIELLFDIRSNPLTLLRPAAFQATPVLFLLAIVMWVLQIVISLPPGAVTVIASPDMSFKTFAVPSFNASFMGNGSGLEANAYSLNLLSPDYPFGFTTDSTANGFVKNSNLMLRLASQVLISGDTLPMPSPCGPNCSYTLEFEGPYFDCNTVSTNITLPNSDSNGQFNIYSSTWFDPRSSIQIRPLYNGTATKARFNSTTLLPLIADADAFINVGSTNNGSILIQQDNVTCIPSRAIFTVNHTYQNNVHTRRIASNSVTPLTNLAPLTKDSAAIVPGFVFSGSAVTEDGLTIPYGTVAANWSSVALDYYRDNNIMAIFDSLMLQLSGTFSADLATPTTLDFLAPDRSMQFTNLSWDAERESAGTLGSHNGSLIGSTRFNAAFGQFSAFASAPPAFNITQELLNSYLFNMTSSVMIAYGNWPTTANASVASVNNVYSFSRPLNLILPYFISLGIAMPFLLLGGFALLRNGVSAMDGSFTQIISTSTGSAVLDQAAAGGCLGGNESVPQELKDLRIRFGEFVGRDEPGRIKRAGFGTESEVIPLKKGTDYGIARWI